MHRSAAAGLACLLGATAAVATVLVTPAPAGAAATGAAMTSTATTGTATTPASPSSTAPCAPPTTPPTRWTAGDLVAGWGFEDGDPAGWAPLGNGPAVSVTAEAAASGTRSLRVDGLGTVATVGVRPVPLPHAGWYKLSARARLKAPANGAFLRLRGTGELEAAVPGVARVTGDGWTQLIAYLRPAITTTPACDGAQRTHPGDGGMELALATPVCAGAPDGATSLYLDDVSITAADSATDGVPSPTTTPVVPVPPPIGCPPPPTTSTPTTSTTPARCVVGQAVTSQWPGGYLATWVVRDATATARAGWTLRVTFPGAQQVVSLWGAGAWSQDGAVVTATGPSWAPIPAGGSVTVGLVVQGTPAPPAAASLDGTGCQVAVT